MTAPPAAVKATARCPHCGNVLPNHRMSLTAVQYTLLGYLRGFIEEHGYAPSFEEIAAARGYRSMATVHEHLANLERKGYIRRRYNEGRSIQILE
jgi:repressor LexA